MAWHNKHSQRQNQLLIKGYSRLFSLFTDNNRVLASNLLHAVLTVLYKKQEDRNKKDLKIKDIINAVNLIAYHSLHRFNFKVEQNSGANFLGKNVAEAEACKYYNQQLVPGKITDVWGREFIFEPRGIRFLYKEKTNTGKHIIAPENYQPRRGKRLPWISYVIQNSREIYKHIEREEYMYCAHASIPLTSAQKNEHFVVLGRAENRKIRFITAYSIESELQFYKAMSCFVPHKVYKSN
jgi:hypothetical protein